MESKSARFGLIRRICRSEIIKYGKGRLLSALFDRSKRIDYEFEEPFFGFLYKGNLRSFLDQEVFFFGYYASSELGFISDVFSYIKSVYNRRPIFYDVGANVGHHSLFGASCGALVVSFEPGTESRERLEEKKVLNNIANINIFPFALGEDSSRLKLFVPKGSNIGSASLVQNHEGIKDVLEEYVSTERGDCAVKQHSISLPDCIKIDVEGFEMYVLKGLRATCTQSRPFILMEISETSRKLFSNERTFRSCFPSDYVFFAVRTERRRLFYSLHPFLFSQDPEIVAIPSEHITAFVRSARCSWLRRALVPCAAL